MNRGKGRAILGGALIALSSLAAATTAHAAEPAEARTNAIHGYVSSTTARLLGTVNPKGSQIQSCEFEYGTTASYGSSIPCDTYPEADEAGIESYVVGAEVTGLEPESTYHFRLVADNGSGGAVVGADRTVTTQAPPEPQAPCTNPPGVPHPANLPPCWAYELLSPVETTGERPNSVVMGPDGDHVWVGSLIPVWPDQATGNGDTFEMTRTSAGWVGRDLAFEPEDPTNMTTGVSGKSSDGTAVLLRRCEEVVISCPVGRTIEFIRRGPGGEQTLMLHAVVGGLPPDSIAGSDDLSRITFATAREAPALLPQDTHTRGEGLYSSHDGALEFLGYDQNGKVLRCGADSGHEQQRGNGFEQTGTSADGRTVVFESPDPVVAGTGGCPSSVDIYIRRDGQSTNISAPRTGDPNFGGSNPDEGAWYVGGDRQGDIAYFITRTKLAAADTNELPDLYRYDLTSDTVVPLTLGADVRQAVVSPRGDYVYFKTTQPIGGEGEAGRENLFLLHGASTRLLATAGEKLGSFEIGGGNGDSDKYSPLTPDGQHLLFSATAQLTGQPTGVKDQVFRYSVPDESLTCVSCRPDGQVPAFRAAKGGGALTANANLRYQSDDGDSVIFVTGEPLLPEDTNTPSPLGGEEEDRKSGSDVYLWHEGTLSLISDGRSETGAERAEIDASGNKVTFLTVADLVDGLATTQLRAYEARLDGGFSRPQPPPPCQGEGCRGAASTASTASTPATSGFSGPGNPTSQRRGNRKPARHKHRHHGKRGHKRHPHAHRIGGRR